MRVEPEGFEQFWQFWMKIPARDTDARGKARLAYVKQVNNGATPEDLFLGAQWYVNQLKDRAFVQLAATWLNGEAWIDQAPKQRAWLSRQIKQSENVVQIQVPKSKFLEEFERAKSSS